MRPIAIRNRVGMTMVEILVAMTLFAIVASSIYKVVITNQRAFGQQMEITSLRQNIRAAAGLLPAELREISAVEGDIVAMASDSIRIRSMRQFGIVCNPPTLTNKGATTNLTMVVRYPLYSSSRDFTTSDSVLLFVDGRTTKRTDDKWVQGDITVITPNTACSDTKTGVQLKSSLSVPAALDSAGFITAGSPIRGYELITYKLFQDTDNKYYLGIRTGTGTLYPLIGPLTGASGLTFAYTDTLGATTADRLAVGQISLVLRAQTERPVARRIGLPANVVDSVTLVVTLRNNARF